MGMSDLRVQSVAFVPDQVVPLRVDAGYAAMIEFAPDEAVDSVVVGNSAVWQVTTSRRGDRLVVKPLASATTSNMIVVTDVRRYVFLLEPAQGQDSAPFVLRFVYPNLPSSPLTSSQAIAEFRVKGDRALRPIAMSDDGRRTTITWNPDATLPAIFAVDAQGKEALINGRMVEGDYVVEGTATTYVFRLGKARATATRQLLKLNR